MVSMRKSDTWSASSKRVTKIWLRFAKKVFRKMKKLRSTPSKPSDLRSSTKNLDNYLKRSVTRWQMSRTDWKTKSSRCTTSTKGNKPWSRENSTYSSQLFHLVKKSELIEKQHQLTFFSKSYKNCPINCPRQSLWLRKVAMARHQVTGLLSLKELKVRVSTILDCLLKSPLCWHARHVPEPPSPLPTTAMWSIRTPSCEARHLCASHRPEEAVTGAEIGVSTMSSMPLPNLLMKLLPTSSKEASTMKSGWLAKTLRKDRRLKSADISRGPDHATLTTL